MPQPTPRTRKPLTWRVGYRPLVFVLLGAALALSFAILDVTLIGLLIQSGGLALPVAVVVGVVLVVGPVVALGLTPPVRQVEAVAAETLLGARFADGTPTAARTWSERRRALAWFVVHLLVGAVVVVVLVVVAIVGASLISLGWRSDAGRAVTWLGWTGLRTSGTWVDAAMPVAGVALLVAGVIACAGLGVAMASLAPALLGPSYDERLRRLEAEAARLAERNRIAREIHDSVGHALSLVSVQAAAARRVIERDPDFAVQALTAIEGASRNAASDLDHMLGLLRDDSQTGGVRTPELDLNSLSALVAATRSAGLDVALQVRGDLAEMPTLVSREAYRITQEALTNALRYSRDNTASVEVRRSADQLNLTITNPYTARAPGDRSGRGLVGVGERVATLGGSMQRDTADDLWRLSVSLPIPRGPIP